MANKVLQLSSIDLTIYSFILPLMRSLREEGHEVCFACRDVGHFKSIEAEGFKGFRIGIQRNLNPFSAILTVIQLVKILRREKIDIIHVHTPIASVLGRFAAGLAGTKTKIYTVHGFYINNRLFYGIEKLFARYFTDYIFTVNNEDLEYATRKGFVVKDRITNINSVGIDIDRFNPGSTNSGKRTELRNTLGIEEEDIVIGFLGRVVEEKGIIDLYKAFKKAARFSQKLKLLIVGPWDAGERDTRTKGILDEMVSDEGMSDRIVFTGYREDIPEILGIMDIFVLPSYREGMPVSLLEAMAMELPVVATDIRGCREEVDSSSGILYMPGDIEGLSSAIDTLLKDREKALEMGKNARRRVIEHFDQRKSIEKQLEVYRKLCK